MKQDGHEYYSPMVIIVKPVIHMVSLPTVTNVTFIIIVV